MTDLVRIENLYAGYGAQDVLHDISLTIAPGEIVTLIGANGAGKTSLIMSLCGVTRVRGKIFFDGRPIAGLPTHQIMRLGMAIAPEGRRVFATMSVHDNLLMGAHFATAAQIADMIAKMWHLFPRLHERAAQLAGTLSGGEQQMLAIARALMSRPKLLLLDEPSLGLAPLVTKQIFAAIADLNRREQLSILLVEQNAHLALRHADRGYVLINGRIGLADTGQALLHNPDVRAAYLGGAATTDPMI